MFGHVDVKSLVIWTVKACREDVKNCAFDVPATSPCV